MLPCPQGARAALSDSLPHWGDALVSACPRKESREQLTNRYRQDGEHLGALAADVWLHTQHPWFSPANQEDLDLHAFLRALEGWLHPGSWTMLCRRRSGLRRGHVWGEEDEDDGDGEPACRVPTSVPQGQERPTSTTTRCHRCGWGKDSGVTSCVCCLRF